MDTFRVGKFTPLGYAARMINPSSPDHDPDTDQQDNQNVPELGSVNAAEDDLPVSRSQRKREAEEITRLGQTISELPESDLQRIPLDERVHTAVYDLRKIRSFGARKRQLHYLGKILRKTDLEPIRAALKAIQLSATAETRLLHAAEHWRERLLSEGDVALGDFLTQFPSANRQQLRQAARNHAREVQATRQKTGEEQKTTTTKAAREIFKLVRATLAAADND